MMRTKFSVFPLQSVLLLIPQNPYFEVPEPTELPRWSPSLFRSILHPVCSASLCSGSAPPQRASWCSSPPSGSHPLLSLPSHAHARSVHVSGTRRYGLVNISRYTRFNKFAQKQWVTAGGYFEKYTSRCLLSWTHPAEPPILFRGNNGCTRAVSSIFPGRQQAGLPKENSGQQPGGQASVQLVSEDPAEAPAGPVRPPLLFLLFQQAGEVSVGASC